MFIIIVGAFTALFIILCRCVESLRENKSLLLCSMRIKARNAQIKMWRLAQGDITKLDTAGSMTSESLSNFRSIDQLTYGNGMWEVIKRYCNSVQQRFLSQVAIVRHKPTLTLKHRNLQQEIHIGSSDFDTFNRV